MYRINLAVEQLDQWKALTRPLSFLTFKSLLHFFILYVFYFWMLSLVFGFFNRFFITILHLAFISFYLSFHNSRDYLFCYVGDTASKLSKYRVFSGPYFPTFGMNTDQKKVRILTLFTQWESFVHYKNSGLLALINQLHADAFMKKCSTE